MRIIADRRIPGKAKENLSRYGELIEFYTEGITYSAVSGHPDIFLCTVEDCLIAAPNIPADFQKELTGKGIRYIKGKSEVGEIYPDSAHYNALITGKYLIHNLNITDPAVLERAEGLEKIHVRQGYARCSLLSLKDRYFLTSDHGICKILRQRGLDTIFINPDKIILTGEHNFRHGFFGGTCGIFEDRVFFLGNPNSAVEFEKACRFIKKAGFEPVSLYDGFPIDAGSIIIIK